MDDAEGRLACSDARWRPHEIVSLTAARASGYERASNSTVTRPRIESFAPPTRSHA